MNTPSSSFTVPASQEIRNFLAIAVEAAQAAGDVIRKGAESRTTLGIERKKSNDFVSSVDKGAEQAIIAIISAHFPDHAIKAEESGNSGNSEYVWLIDPLDGTTNFLHEIPQYCVSIALQISGQVTVGVVFDPVHNRLFTATFGGGAWLNAQRIYVSSRPGLSEALIGTGLPFSDWSYLDDYLDSLRVIMQRCAGIRRAGAAALDLAFVAAGWLDGYWEKNLHAWDVGAGSLLVREAGGLVSDFSGTGNFIAARQMIAGTAGVHRELVEVLRGYPQLNQPPSS